MMSLMLNNLQFFINLISKAGCSKMNIVIILLYTSTMMKATSGVEMTKGHHLNHHHNEMLEKNVAVNKSNMRSLNNDDVATKAFTETVIIRMGYVPDLPKLDEKEIIAMSLRIFLEDEKRNIQKLFENINVEYMRGNLEKHRESLEHDILLILTISGDYNPKNHQHKALERIKTLFLNNEDTFVDILHELSDDSFYFSSVSKIIFVTDVPSLSSESNSVSSSADESDEDITSFDILEASYMNQSLVVACVSFALGMGLLIAAVVHLRGCKRSERSMIHSTGIIMSTIDEKSICTQMTEMTDHRIIKESIPEEVEVVFKKIDLRTVSSPSYIARKKLIDTDEIRGEFRAPPGKLGVALDTVQGCPVVHKIKPGSPLHGVLMRKDRIVGIDEVDTTFMSAAEVTKLMVTRMKSFRNISYVRGGDFFNGDDHSMHTNASM